MVQHITTVSLPTRFYPNISKPAAANAPWKLQMQRNCSDAQRKAAEQHTKKQSKKIRPGSDDANDNSTPVKEDGLRLVAENIKVITQFLVAGQQHCPRAFRVSICIWICIFFTC